MTASILAVFARLVCAWLGHRYRFVRISLESDRVLICRRCGERWHC